MFNFPWNKTGGVYFLESWRRVHVEKEGVTWVVDITTGAGWNVKERGDMKTWLIDAWWLFSSLGELCVWWFGRAVTVIRRSGRLLGSCFRRMGVVCGTVSLGFP